MADAHDASSVPRSRAATILVNQREIMFDLATGEILAGPPALVGKFVTTEQIADMLAQRGPVIDHLHTADTQEGLRLAKVDYLTAKRREQSGEFAVGSHVQFGKHGVFRILSFDPSSKQYRMTAGGREISVPRERLESEGKLVEQGTPRAEIVPAVQVPEQVESGGSIEIDDEDLRRIVGEVTRAWLDDHKSEIVAALAHHTAEGGNTPSVQ